jgi:hypothetical protein
MRAANAGSRSSRPTGCAGDISSSVISRVLGGASAANAEENGDSLGRTNRKSCHRKDGVCRHTFQAYPFLAAGADKYVGCCFAGVPLTVWIDCLSTLNCPNAFVRKSTYDSVLRSLYDLLNCKTEIGLGKEIHRRKLHVSSEYSPCGPPAAI